MCCIFAVLFSCSTRSSDSVYDPVEFESADSPWSSKPESNQGWPPSIEVSNKGQYTMFVISKVSFLILIIAYSAEFF